MSSSHQDSSKDPLESAKDGLQKSQENLQADVKIWKSRKPVTVSLMLTCLNEIIVCCSEIKAKYILEQLRKHKKLSSEVTIWLLLD